MAKSKTASFVVELGLVTHQNEQVVLDKRFKIAEKLYNKVLYHAQTQLTELYKNHRYQDVLAERRLSIKANDKNRVTACNKELQTIQKTFGMTEYALHAYIGRMREAYKKHIDSFTAQKIASTVWTSVSSLLDDYFIFSGVVRSFGFGCIAESFHAVPHPPWKRNSCSTKEWVASSSVP